MAHSENRQDGQLILTTGMTRSGKTALSLERTATEPRLLVFDFPGRDWPRANCRRIEGLAELAAALLEVRDGPLRVSYRAPELTSREFGRFAQAALAWSHYAPACIVAEELADVVHPGKAPAGWGELVRGGLAYGNTIIGITQRPAETDKSIFGNATTLRIFRCAHFGDALYLSRATGIPVDTIAGLNQLEYAEKHVGSDAVEVKRLSF